MGKRMEERRREEECDLGASLLGGKLVNLSTYTLLALITQWYIYIVKYIHP
jgi:hypothetical protein